MTSYAINVLQVHRTSRENAKKEQEMADSFKEMEEVCFFVYSNFLEAKSPPSIPQCTKLQNIIAFHPWKLAFRMEAANLNVDFYRVSDWKCLSEN